LAQMWLFIDPGLYRQERLYALPVILASVIFFLAGGAFGYLVLFPVMAGFFINMGVSGNMLPLLSANALFGFLLRTLLGCAIVFEWPVVVFFSRPYENPYRPDDAAQLPLRSAHNLCGRRSGNTYSRHGNANHPSRANARALCARYLNSLGCTAPQEIALNRMFRN